MATTDKPIALQTDMQKTTTSFESFLTPEEAQAVEEQLEAQEEVVEEEELEEIAESLEDEEEVEELEEEEIEEEVEQPQLYTIKVDGVEQEVTLEELQNGYSRQQDYTRKTQELSQQRRLIEQQQAELSQRDAVYSQLLPKMEAQLKGELENEPNWQQLSEDDPIAYVREKQVWDQKKEKLQAVQAEQQRIQQEALVQQQQQIAQVVQYGQQKLLELIPEWSDEKIASKEKAAIRDYGINTLGYTPEEMDSVYDYRACLVYDLHGYKAKTQKP